MDGQEKGKKWLKEVRLPFLCGKKKTQREKKATGK